MMLSSTRKYVSCEPSNAPIALYTFLLSNSRLPEAINLNTQLGDKFIGYYGARYSRLISYSAFLTSTIRIEAESRKTERHYRQVGMAAILSVQATNHSNKVQCLIWQAGWGPSTLLSSPPFPLPMAHRVCPSAIHPETGFAGLKKISCCECRAIRLDLDEELDK